MAPEDGWSDEGRIDRVGGESKGAPLRYSARVTDSSVDLLPLAEGLREGEDCGF
jgi:hypothetical protein